MRLADYQQRLEADYRRGNATEHTYRGTLKALLESIFPGIVATNEPKRIKAGAPEYVITRGDGEELGVLSSSEVIQVGPNPDKPIQKVHAFPLLTSLHEIAYRLAKYYTVKAEPHLPVRNVEPRFVYGPTLFRSWLAS